MTLKRQIKNIVLSLYKIVQGQYTSYIKKYSIIENQFGKQIQIFLFKNCSGQSVLAMESLSKGLINTLLKDLIKNEYIDMKRTMLPQYQDMTIYGGRNQAYLGFSKIVYSYDCDKAIEQFKRLGYSAVEKEVFSDLI